MDKLLNLFSACKYSVTIEYNPHRDLFETVEEYVNSWGTGNERDNIADEVFNEMVKRNTIVLIQYYPDSPGLFYAFFHYDLSLALDIVMAD